MGEGDGWDSTEGMAMVFWRERGADSFLGEFEKNFFSGGGCKPQSLKTLCHIMIIKLCHDGIKEFWSSQIV